MADPPTSDDLLRLHSGLKDQVEDVKESLREAKSLLRGTAQSFLAVSSSTPSRGSTVNQPGGSAGGSASSSSGSEQNSSGGSSQVEGRWPYGDRDLPRRSGSGHSDEEAGDPALDPTSPDDKPDIQAPSTGLNRRAASDSQDEGSGSIPSSTTLRRGPGESPADPEP